MNPRWASLPASARGLAFLLTHVLGMVAELPTGRQGAAKTIAAVVGAHLGELRRITQDVGDLVASGLLVIGEQCVSWDLSEVCASPVTSSAVRMRRKRERDRASPDASHVTSPVTSHQPSQVTSPSDAAPLSPSHTLPLSPRDLTHSPQPPTASPEAAQILAAIAAKPSLAAAATVRLAEAIEGRRMARGTPILTVLAAIDECGRDAEGQAAVGAAWDVARTADRLARYCDKAGQQRMAGARPTTKPHVQRDTGPRAWEVPEEAR